MMNRKYTRQTLNDNVLLSYHVNGMDSVNQTLSALIKRIETLEIQVRELQKA